MSLISISIKKGIGTVKNLLSKISTFNKFPIKCSNFQEIFYFLKLYFFL